MEARYRSTRTHSSTAALRDASVQRGQELDSMVNALEYPTGVVALCDGVCDGARGAPAATVRSTSCASPPSHVTTGTRGRLRTAPIDGVAAECRASTLRSVSGQGYADARRAHSRSDPRHFLSTVGFAAATPSRPTVRHSTGIQHETLPCCGAAADCLSGFGAGRQPRRGGNAQMSSFNVGPSAAC